MTSSLGSLLRGDGVKSWVTRTLELRRELAEIADPERWWWLLAGGVAFAETHAPAGVYLACDVEADADTFMGYRAAPPGDPVADAIARARAARTTLRELDGTFPGQPLAVTIDHSAGTRTPRSTLDVAAFAIADRCLIAELDDPELATRLAAVLAGERPARWTGTTPFVCVSIGDEPIETARHGHRRAWTEGGGPWLGLGRTGGLAVVSTCHLIVDGYGHACLTARIAELCGTDGPAPSQPLPALTTVPGAIPLAVVSRELPSPTPRVIPLAYELGRILHRDAGRRGAKFSPTIQIPIARGRKDDPLRVRRRVVSATTSVRFEGGVPEPFASFEARVRGVIVREAASRGLVSRFLAAARAVPVPLAWKRKGISAARPHWLDTLAEVIGGRALLSRIVMDTPSPPLVAVSSPSRLASEADPVGGCVITIVDDRHRGAITVCGSGFAGSTATATAFLDELLETAAPVRSRAAGGE